MDNVQELEIVDLGDAKEVTMGIWGPNTENNPVVFLEIEG